MLCSSSADCWVAKQAPAFPLLPRDFTRGGRVGRLCVIKQDNSYKGSPRSDRSRLYAAGNLVGVSYAARNAQRCSHVPTRKEGQGFESTSDTEQLIQSRRCHSGLVHRQHPSCICHTLSIDHPMSPCRETDSTREAG
jgi:hypothetical protein